jgi:hypothetical protein
MSIQAVAWALDQYIADPREKLILISLANHADHVTGECWPAMKTIAREASCRRETVLRKLPALVEAGFVEILKAKQGDRRRAHTYRLLIHRCAPDAQQTDVTGAHINQPRCAPQSQGVVTTGVTTEPSFEPSFLKPLQKLGKGSGPGRGTQAARPERISGSEVIQNQIALRLGPGGWIILGELTDARRDELTAMQRQGRLDEAALDRLRLEHAVLTSRDRRGAL